MQEGRLKVVDVDTVRCNVVAVIIGLTKNGATLHPAASQPNAEAARVVVASIVLEGQPAL